MSEYSVFKHRMMGLVRFDPAEPGRKVPSSGRRIAVATFAVVARMTSVSGVPRHRNFDNVVAWSNTGPSRLRLCTSDEIVSGMKPASSMACAVARVFSGSEWPQSAALFASIRSVPYSRRIATNRCSSIFVSG